MSGETEHTPTQQTLLTLDTRPVTQSLNRLARDFAAFHDNLAERLAPALQRIGAALVRAMADPLLHAYERANDPVRVAGLEARYYVRGAMDPQYATPEGLRSLVRSILTPGRSQALTQLSGPNRRLLAVAAMRGWETRGEHRLGPVECDLAGRCAYADAVGMPEHGASCTGELWRCEGMTYEEPPLVLHRQWGTTQVQVRCG